MEQRVRSFIHIIVSHWSLIMGMVCTFMIQTEKSIWILQRGIAVQAFGYNNKEYNDALKAQIDKVMHTSNLYYNVPIMNAAKRLLKASRMDRVFFTNSGTEAIEEQSRRRRNMLTPGTDMQDMRSSQ